MPRRWVHGSSARPNVLIAAEWKQQDERWVSVAKWTRMSVEDREAIAKNVERNNKKSKQGR